MYLKNFKFCLFVLLASFFSFVNSHAVAQESVSENSNFQVYKVWSDANADLNNAIKFAQKHNKHIVVFVGGNWCVWCKRLHYFMKSSLLIEKELNNYVVLHINFSKENKNEAILAKFNNPQQFGFPVTVVLDQNGKYLFTQPSSDWEEGKSYNEVKIADFLKQWTFKSINKKK